MNNENKNDKFGYSDLKGWRRIIPVALVAIAAFVAVCFFTEGTGLLGDGVGSVLLGLFSFGAYAIPILLVLHAVFYAGDHHEGLTVSRSVFSFLTVLIVSGVEYIINYWSDPVFNPVEFYINRTAGGFVGSTVAYGITKIFGPVGLIIISLAILAVYVAFFFTKGNNAFSRSVLAVIGALANGLAAIERRINKIRDDSRALKEEKLQQEEERRSAELMDDSFFSVDNELKNLKIDELGIRPPQDNGDRGNEITVGALPRFADEEDVEAISVTLRKEPVAPPSKPKRSFSSDYGLPIDDEPKAELKAEVLVAKETSESRKKDFVGLDESADSVFTKDFDPFDFATSDKIICAPSRTSAHTGGINEVTTPLSAISESDLIIHRRKLAEERRRSEFEEKKRQILNGEAMHRSAEKTPSSKPVDVPKPGFSGAMDMIFGTPHEEREIRPTETKPVAPISDEQRNNVPVDNDDAAARVSEMVERNVTGYTRSANRSYTYTKVTVEEDAHEIVELEDTSITDVIDKADSISLAAFSSDTADEAANPIDVFDTVRGEDVANNNDASVQIASVNEECSEFVLPEIVTPEIEATESTFISSALVEDEPNQEDKLSDDIGEDGSSLLAADNHANEPAISEYSTALPTESEERTEFKPYEAPAIPEAEAIQETQPELKIERTMLTPSYSAAEKARDSKYTVISSDMAPATEELHEELEIPEDGFDWSVAPERISESDIDAAEPDGTVFDFGTTDEPDEPSTTEISNDEIVIFGGIDELDDVNEANESDKSVSEAEIFGEANDGADEDSDEYDDDDVEPSSGEDEDGEGFGEEIPPEEQNPEIIRQREMFSFLRNETTPADVGNAENESDVKDETGDEAHATEEIKTNDDSDVNREIMDAPVKIDDYEEEINEPEKIDEPEEEIEEPLEADEPEEEIEEPAEADEPEEEIEEPAEADEPEEDPDDVPFDFPFLKKESTAMVTKEEKPKPAKPDYSNYVFPPLDLLGLDSNSSSDDDSFEIQENADRLIETLASFNVTASIKGVDRGPRITRYEVVPAKGVKVSSIMNLQDDIALSLAADGIRMEAPIPGKSAVGVEIPNKRSETVRLRELIETDEFTSKKSKTAICIGKDVAGMPVINDVATMPHLLIAGATGMGKSVCINSLLISILYKAKPDEVKLIMIDPKQVEFTMYNGIPHLLIPVVSEPKQAAGALMWAVDEMEKRFAQLNAACVRNIDGYNEAVAKDPSIGEPMSKIIIVIDEFADLMLQVKDPVESLVMRIAQKARAAGIHLIIGTQRPSTNVITGTIKANIPSRMSCKVASNVDSRTVLDGVGAEKLLNKGDMLFAFAGAIKPLRVQGAFVSDGEVLAIMNHLKQFSTGDNYDESVIEEIKRAAEKCNKKGGGAEDEGPKDEGGYEYYLRDRQFLEAVEVAVNSGKISTSLLQRRISIGYGKAAKFIDVMCDMGVVGEPNGQKPRDVKMTPDEWAEKLARISFD